MKDKIDLIFEEMVYGGIIGLLGLIISMVLIASDKVFIAFFLLLFSVSLLTIIFLDVVNTIRNR